MRADRLVQFTGRSGIGRRLVQEGHLAAEIQGELAITRPEGSAADPYDFAGGEQRVERGGLISEAGRQDVALEDAGGDRRAL